LVSFLSVEQSISFNFSLQTKNQNFMKKNTFQLLTLIALLLFFSTSLFAQDDSTSTEEVWKAEWPQVTVEYQFAPWSPTPLAIENLRMRYFLDYYLALRAGLILDMTMDKKSTDPVGSATLSKNAFKIGAKAGLEFHFEGTKRLAPYWGFELMFAMRSVTEKTDDGAGTTLTQKGAWSDVAGIGIGIDQANRGYTQFGAMPLLGADFYLAPRLYVGAELGLMYQTTIFKEVTFEATGLTTTTLQKSDSQHSIKIDANRLIRLGYVF
jgi:hypothetical protein